MSYQELNNKSPVLRKVDSLPFSDYTSGNIDAELCYHPIADSGIEKQRLVGREISNRNERHIECRNSFSVPLIHIRRGCLEHLNHSNQPANNYGNTWSQFQHFFLSECCQKTLAIINATILLILSVLVIVDIWDILTGNHFLDPENETTRKLTLQVDWIVTVVLLVEISFRFAASRSATLAALKNLSGDLLVLVSSIASIVVTIQMELSTLQREEAVAAFFALRVFRDAIRLSIAVYFLRQLNETRVDFTALQSRELQAVDDEWDDFSSNNMIRSDFYCDLIDSHHPTETSFNRSQQILDCSVQNKSSRSSLVT